jgi:hypothetical protein
VVHFIGTTCKWIYLTCFIYSHIPCSWSKCMSIWKHYVKINLSWRFVMIFRSWGTYWIHISFWVFTVFRGIEMLTRRFHQFNFLCILVICSGLTVMIVVKH